MLRCTDLGEDKVRCFAGRYGISVVWVAAGLPVTGSFWGEPEAGVVGRQLFLRADTPVHSLLHELCHVVCASPERRAKLNGNAMSDDVEESAVCYLQIVLAEQLPGVGRQRIMRDMDEWGYSFRLGNAKRWFEEDADDARNWLLAEELLDKVGNPVFKLRGT